MTSAAPGSAAQAAERVINRKSRVGTVVSDVNDQTVIVAIERVTRHRLYHKVLRRTKRYPVHDPQNEATLGDTVRIEECRPISKTKRWRLVEVLTERAVADVAAEEIDVSLVEELQRSPARAAAEAEGEAGATAAPATDAMPGDAMPDAAMPDSAMSDDAGADDAGADDAGADDAGADGEAAREGAGS